MKAARFQPLIDTWYEHLYRFALILSCNGDEAMDLTQQTFTLAHDTAFQYRLWPQALSGSGVPSFVYGMLELNGIWAERDRFGGVKLADSGGYTLFLSPGLQYVTQRWVAEVSVQLPLIQELNDGQLKTDYILSAGHPRPILNERLPFVSGCSTRIYRWTLHHTTGCRLSP